MTAIIAGVSGFAYKEWRGSVYPAKLPASAMLAHYAQRLPAVEINSTFYRMPSRDLLERWAAQVPRRFRFTLKAPARITHRKKLVHAEEESRAFIETALSLGEHLGALLFQLPPSLRQDLPLLEKFLGSIAGIRAAIEFRHASWFQEETYRLLRESGCALCVSDREEGTTPPVVPTAPFGYLRLRRPEYSSAELAKWRQIIEAQGWDEAFVFFRHEQKGEGVNRALLLMNG